LKTRAIAGISSSSILAEFKLFKDGGAMARAQKTTYVTAEKTRVNGVDQEAVVFLNGNVWHYRLTFDGGKTYMRGTTKCREEAEAVRFARELFFGSSFFCVHSFWKKLVA
jgi:hypothetical protein